jgi:hypothetical protein
MLPIIEPIALTSQTSICLFVYITQDEGLRRIYQNYLSIFKIEINILHRSN